MEENRMSLINISIHASAKEATNIPVSVPFHHCISIHASAKEATRPSLLAMAKNGFQSTPPRRRRQCSEENVRIAKIFQSTPPRRRRQEWFRDKQMHYIISIHASAKEATVDGVMLR